MSTKLLFATPQKPFSKILSTFLSLNKSSKYIKTVFVILGMFLFSEFVHSQSITVTALSPTSATTTYGTQSSNLTFNVSGRNLTAGILVTPPTGFIVSLTGLAGSFSTTVTVGTGGTIAATPVYVALASTDAVGNYSGNIGCTSTGATKKNAAIATSTVSTAALTITANDVDKLYGVSIAGTGGTGSTAFTSSGLVNGETIGTVKILYGTGKAAGAAVGTYSGSVTPSAATGGTFTKSNYTITYVAGSIIVTPASLTITANNISKCNGAIYTFLGTEFTTSGLVNGDTVTKVKLASAGAIASAPAGSYTITASNARGSGLMNYIITYNAGTLTVDAAFSLTIVQVNPDCNAPTGSLSSTVSGGTSPYAYKYNTGSVYNPSGTFVSTPLFSGLPAGYYAYGAEDADGCVATKSTLQLKVLTQTPAIISSPSSAVCYGDSLTIYNTPSGGNGPFTYSVDGGDYGSSRFFFVPAGSHTISVLDNNGCSYTTDPVVVTQPSQPVGLTDVATNPNCVPGTGSIVVTATGGFGSPYTYSDDGGITYQASGSFTGLSAQRFNLIVKDENGCVSATSVSESVVDLTSLTALPIQGTLTVCPGSTTIIYTSGSYGIPPYSYKLNNGLFQPSSKRFFQVPAGTDSITVEDNSGCTYVTPSVVITTGNCSDAPQQSAEEISKKVMSQEPEAVLFEAKVSPNPAQAAFHVQLKSGDRSDVEITVTNMTGQKMYETKGTIDQLYQFGAEFTSGIYILQIRQGNALHTVKLVKSN
jgi:hypothetical protein